MSRISRVPGLVPGVLVAAFLASGLALARPALADEEAQVSFEPRVKPTAVAPGGKGTLHVKGTIVKGLHVYADKRFKVVPESAKGVTYGETKILTEPVPFKDPNFPDDPPDPVWFDKVEFEIPFSLAADAPDPAHVQVGITWNGCTSDICYLNVKNIVHAYVSTVAVVELWVVPKQVKVRFTPKTGYHLNAPGVPNVDSVKVEGKPVAGVTWSPAAYPVVEAEIKSPFDVSLPVAVPGTSKVLAKVHVHWQGCTNSSCLSANDETPEFSLTHFADDAAAPAPPPANPVPTGGMNDEPPGPAPVPAPAPAPEPPSPPAAPVPPAEPGPTASAGISGTGVLFPLYEGKSGTAVIGSAERSYIQRKWEELGILILGPIFLIGLLLAFTPCVLPIIPITVSIIGGGNPDLPKSRLTVLLCAYVSGLALAFGSLGLIAALTGGSISAAFESKTAIWAIAGVFTLLALGMVGIYELQPPDFLQKLQGGAKGGSVVGAFLFGALGAVIASPCTGPVIAGMLVFTAQGGNALVGFLMFVTLGLGMGSVFFAAGSLNLVMRPGPWMVWIRYGFGAVLIGAALYYVALRDLLTPTGVFAVGFGLAILVAVGIARHLVKAEGESLPPAAARGAKVAVLVALATGLVAFLTRTSAEATEGWITLKDRAQMVAEVDKAKVAGRSSVVDVWATTCHFCLEYDKVIEADPVLKGGFEKLNRMRVDVTDGQHPELNDGVGIGSGHQPQMVFIDAQGRIRRDMDIDGWAGSVEKAKEALKARLRGLGVLPAETASAGK